MRIVSQNVKLNQQVSAIINTGLAMFLFPLLWSFLMQTMVRFKDKHRRMSECQECNAFVYSPVPLRGKIDPSWNALKFQFLLTSKLGCANPGGFWHHDVFAFLLLFWPPLVIHLVMALWYTDDLFHPMYHSVKKIHVYLCLFMPGLVRLFNSLC